MATQSIDYNSSENQQIKRDFVDREVYCNVNQMAEYILQKSYEDSDAPFTYDELNLERYSYSGNYIAFDDITRLQKEEAEEELQELIDKLYDFGEFEIRDADYYYLREGDYTSDQIEEMQGELSDIEDLDSDYVEIYEWWAVSQWLAEKLEEKGEIIAYAGMTCIWGRRTSGQAILLDWVISQICEDLNMLK